MGSSYSCTECNKSISSKDELNFHLVKVHAYKPCSICSQGFLDAAAVDKHISRDHPPCRYGSDHALVSHRHEPHNFPCTICTMRFTSETRLGQHNKKEHQCQHCQMICGSMDKHNRENHYFPCQFCNAAFFTAGVRDEHLRSLHDHLCEHCNIIFRHKSEYDDHNESEHEWECDYCDEVFSLEEELDDHLETADHSFPCGYCTREFGSYSALTQHNEAVHSFPCDCGKAFRSKKALAQHQDASHYTQHNLPNPVDSAGFWCPRKQLLGTLGKTDYKSFGAFECATCNSKWISAHAFAQYKQACKRCETWSYAEFLWVNKGHSGARNTSDNKKPHDQDRCGACMKGVCLK